MPQTGTVKFFNHAKGFGFITPEDGEKDVFVHISAVQASGLTGLEDGQKVTFETEPDKRGKGPKAVNLSVDAELLARAKAAKVNLSSVLEEALSRSVREREERRWRDENKSAIEAYNRFTEENGIFGEDFRSF